MYELKASCLWLVNFITEYAVADAGTVTVAFDGSSVELVDFTAFDGWTGSVEQAGGLEVEVKFLNGNRRVDFEAEIEDGMVKTRVRERTVNGGGDDDRGGSTTSTTSTTMAPSGDDSGSVSDEPTVIDASPAGTVVVQVDGGALTLVDITTNAGWQAQYEVESDKIKVEFHDGSMEVEVEVEFEHGHLEIEVEMHAEDSGSSSSGNDSSSDDDSSGRSSDDHDDDDNSGSSSDDDDDDDNSGSGSDDDHDDDDDDDDDDDHDDDHDDDDDDDDDDDRDDD